MALTPDDIINHEFNLAVRGYAKGEVDDLLDRLADQIERAEQDLGELRDRVRVAEERAQEATRTEATLKRTLVTAEDAAQRTLDDARSRAEAIRADAEQEAADMRDEAGRVVDAARADAERDAAEIRERLAAERSSLAERVTGIAEIEERYRGQFRDLLESQLGALTELEAWGPPGGDDVAAIRSEFATRVDPSGEAGVVGEPEVVGDEIQSSADDRPGVIDVAAGEPEEDSDDADFPSFSGLKVRVHTDEPDPS